MNETPERSSSWDPDALKAGASVTVVFAAPFLVAARLVADNNPKSSLALALILLAIVGFVLGFIGIAASVAFIIQWFHILILGNRNEWLSDVAKGYLEYLVNVMGYTYIMTDSRPEIFPVPVKIYKE